MTAIGAKPAGPPAAPWIYGLLGLIPFLGCAGAALLGPVAFRLEAEGVERVYGALILSFLGGARWGLEIRRPRPRALIISASMAPTLAGFGLVLIPLSGAGFAALALAFLAQFAWDLRSEDAPTWYPPLRSVLTAGAVLSLLGCAVASGVGR